MIIIYNQSAAAARVENSHTGDAATTETRKRAKIRAQK